MTLNAKKIIKIVSFSIFLIFIIIFVFWGTREILEGVKIKNVNIIDGTKITESVLKITGNALNAKNLRLNDNEISIDQEGNFSETIILSLGYNIISILALDKFGNTDEKNYKLMLTQALGN